MPSQTTTITTALMSLIALTLSETFPFRDSMSDITTSPYWIDFGSISLTSTNCPSGASFPRCVQLNPGGELYFLHFNLVNASEVSIEFNLAIDTGDDTSTTSTTTTTIAPLSSPPTLPTLSIYHSCDTSRWNMATWTLLTQYTALKTQTLPTQRHSLPAQCDHALDFNLAFIAHFETAVSQTSATIDSFAILPRTDAPTKSPSRAPTKSPTTKPTAFPTSSPTLRPTKEPTTSPTESTSAPTMVTQSPTESTASPTNAPSEDPTNGPTQIPTKGPTQRPSLVPTQNTNAPTMVTSAPTMATHSPTENTRAPTMATRAPTKVTLAPTRATRAPTEDPTVSPSEAPTVDLVRYLARFNPTATTTPSPVIGGHSDSESGEEGGSDGFREGTASPTAAPSANGGGRWRVGGISMAVLLVAMIGMA